MSSPNVVSINTIRPEPATDASEYIPGKMYRDSGNDLWVAIVDSDGVVGLLPMMDDYGNWVDDPENLFRGSRYENVQSTPVDFYITTNPNSSRPF